MPAKTLKSPKTRLTKKEIDRILSLKGVFIRAQKLVGVPWQAMAAIWYRESFSVASPKTPGGPFQFDPPNPSKTVLLKSLKRYIYGLSDNELQTIVDAGVNDFPAACILAACHLRDKAKFVLATDHTDTSIKDAFYGYNGRAWGPHPESSPYVMNNFDDAHLNMRIRGTVPDGHGGEIWIDTIDLQPGAFTIYNQLILVD